MSELNPPKTVYKDMNGLRRMFVRIKLAQDTGLRASFIIGFLMLCLSLLFIQSCSSGSEQEDKWYGFNYNPANGHYYTLTTSVSWEEAEKQANDWGGHLVTINNLEEEQWLQAMFSALDQYWIGLNDRDVEGTFEWISGAPVNYTNWLPNEPNNDGGLEDVVVMNYVAWENGDKRWNDVQSGQDPRKGIAEVEGDTFPWWIVGASVGGAAILVILLLTFFVRKRVHKSRLENERISELKGQMQKWREQGYDVSGLEVLFNDTRGNVSNDSISRNGIDKVQGANKLSFAKSDLDRILEVRNYTPLKLVELLEKDFKEEYSGDLGLTEKYSLKAHTLMVLGQFEKYFSQKDLPPSINIDFFRLILAMHDIGKPLAVRMGVPHQSRQFTVRMVTTVLTELGYSAQDIEIASALVFGDPIGQYLKVKDVNIADVKRSAEMIWFMAKQTNMQIGDFFNLLLIYYMSDASSYTLDAGGKKSLDYLFIFNPGRRKLEFAPYIARKIEDLRTFV